MASSSTANSEELKQRALAMLEMELGHNPQLLAAAKAQMEERMNEPDAPSFLQGVMDHSPEGKIEVCRKQADTYYLAITGVLDDPLWELLQSFDTTRKKQNSDHADGARVAAERGQFAAVDLAAGPAYLTYQYATRYFNTGCTSLLDWYPTDTQHTLEHVTRQCLEFMMEDLNAEKAQGALCTDRNGIPLYQGNPVTLQGLSNEKYNGRLGKVLCPDPSGVVGRYAVQMLDDDEDVIDDAPPLSFNAVNLVLAGSGDDDKEQIINGLLERACPLNILQRDTWSTLLQTLGGQCALVTCTNLLSEIGHSDPMAWKNVMEIASQLLQSGGLLMHGDADGWGLGDESSFGNMPAMMEYAKTVGLQGHTELRMDSEGWALVIWKKM
jgi:hypothetical protein